MVSVYYTSIYHIDKIDMSFFSEYRKNRLSKTKNETHRLQSVFSEYLLCFGATEHGHKIPVDIFITKNGKPESHEFSFSISHSKNVVAVAVSDVPVGVDVQFKNTALNMSVKEKIFTSSECENINIDDFYKKFTMKESYYKMTGQGLPLSPIGFSDFAPCFFDTYETDEYAFSVCTEKKTDVKYQYVDFKKLI